MLYVFSVRGPVIEFFILKSSDCFTLIHDIPLRIRFWSRFIRELLFIYYLLLAVHFSISIILSQNKEKSIISLKEMHPK